MVARAGVAAKFTFLIHSHMLRHACGFKLANDGIAMQGSNDLLHADAALAAQMLLEAMAQAAPQKFWS
jgi:hypothetical protein